MNNRQFKFRVRHNNAWIYGPDYEVNLLGEVVLLGQFLAGIPSNELNNCQILQFTGLQDKNGHEIYEGDIVEYKWQNAEHETEEAIGEVFFKDGIFFFDKNLEFTLVDSNFIFKELEVIGNVFDNPELFN